jgi:hypothetical protein
LKDLSVDKRIILKWIPKEYGRKEWAKFVSEQGPVMSSEQQDDMKI